MRVPVPEPTPAVPTRAEVFLGYLDYFRDRLVSKLEALPAGELRRSRLPSGWKPLQVVEPLTHSEGRWREWGSEGHDVPDPWGDRRDDRWHVADGETLEDLVQALHDRAAHTRALVGSHDLAEAGQPSPRWSGAEPATLE